jgi:ArsR family metal-binding transcriptional regulator
MCAAREIYLARPCIENPNLFIAESSFGRSLDMEIVCNSLKQLQVPEMRCSPRLGVARFRLDDCKIMIYRNGRIDIRKVSGKDEASKAIDRVEIMLENAFLI